MEKSELNFKGGNPGAVQYGNFINYYQFHPPETRLKLLPTDIWPKSKPFCALDIGCNSGDLTVALYSFLNEKVENCSILGIDIDPVLIERANEQNQNKENIQFHCFDFMTNHGENFIKDYLKKRKLGKFDAVFCFSVTMWIHLNYGDDGLMEFLSKLCNFGELIIIEPQPWKCYRSAIKRMRLSHAVFPLFTELKITHQVEEEIEQFLLETMKVSKVYESETGEWGRKLLIFT